MSKKAKGKNGSSVRVKRRGREAGHNRNEQIIKRNYLSLERDNRKP
jgi:hypothetical protein